LQNAVEMRDMGVATSSNTFFRSPKEFTNFPENIPLTNLTIANAEITQPTAAALTPKDLE